MPPTHNRAVILCVKATLGTSKLTEPEYKENNKIF
jgi:hypothetical protein